MAQFPFQFSPVYTAVSIAYMNREMIADRVLPRIPTAQLFKYVKHTEHEAFSPPDDFVGRKGRVTQVDFTQIEETASTIDYALEDVIPALDVEVARAQMVPAPDPRTKAVLFLSKLLELRREKRCADLVFNAASYPTGYKVQLSGTGQYSDFTNSNPVSGIMSYLDVPLYRPNLMVLGQDSWRVIRQHPDILTAIKSTGGDVTSGFVSRQQVADLFEIDEVIVGQPRLNTAAPGQTPTYSRVWGKHIALLYRDNGASEDPTPGLTTWGFTGQFGTRIAGTITDPNVGMRGGEKVRVGWSLKELVSASNLGYFIQDAVA